MRPSTANLRDPPLWVFLTPPLRTSNDIIEYAKENNVAGLLLLIDFKRTYYSISFNYIIRCLKFFSFCDIVKWVQILRFDFKAVINHCGNCSNSFDIGRGCRQGDLIASYLLILCIETLAHKLRTALSIKHFFHKNVSHLLEIYANVFFLFNPTSESLNIPLSMLDSLFSVSKTKAVWSDSTHCVQK